MHESAVLGRHEQCYSTVTHFNVIHFACHREASRAERTMKQPKEEWEGATLRNSQTKCNNLLPMHTPSVSEEAYAICVEQWWAHLGHLGRVDAPRCKLACIDLKLLLLRFAMEESFSTYSKGGGRYFPCDVNGCVCVGENAFTWRCNLDTHKLDWHSQDDTN